MLAKSCGKTKDQLLKDMDRNFWMSAEEAKKYGIVDDILKPKKK